MVARHVDADEEAGVRVEAVDAGTAASGSAYLAFVQKEAVTDEFASQFGDGRHADSERLAEVGDAGLVVLYAQTEYLTLDESVFAGVAEETVGHCCSVIMQKYQLIPIFVQIL